MTRFAGEQTKLGSIAFAEGVQPITSVKARGRPGNAKSIYNFKGSPHISNR